MQILYKTHQIEVGNIITTSGGELTDIPQEFLFVSNSNIDAPHYAFDIRELIQNIENGNRLHNFYNNKDFSEDDLNILSKFNTTLHQAVSKLLSEQETSFPLLLLQSFKMFSANFGPNFEPEYENIVLSRYSDSELEKLTNPASDPFETVMPNINGENADVEENNGEDEERISDLRQLEISLAIIFLQRHLHAFNLQHGNIVFALEVPDIREANDAANFTSNNLVRDVAFTEFCERYAALGQREKKAIDNFKSVKNILNHSGLGNSLESILSLPPESCIRGVKTVCDYILEETNYLDNKEQRYDNYFPSIANPSTLTGLKGKILYLLNEIEPVRISSISISNIFLPSAIDEFKRNIKSAESFTDVLGILDDVRINNAKEHSQKDKLDKLLDKWIPIVAKLAENDLQLTHPGMPVISQYRK